MSDCATRACASIQTSPLCFTGSMGATTTMAWVTPTISRRKFVNSVAAGTEPRPVLKGSLRRPATGVSAASAMSNSEPIGGEGGGEGGGGKLSTVDCVVFYELWREMRGSRTSPKRPASGRERRVATGVQDACALGQLRLRGMRVSSEHALNSHSIFALPLDELVQRNMAK